MIVEPGAVVAYTCVIRDLHGAVLSATPDEVPLRALHGVTPVLPGVRQALAGAAVGDARAAEVDDVGGPHDPDKVRVVARGDWPDSVVPEVGLVVRYTEHWPSGEATPFAGRIVSVDADTVVVDGNPALAGQRVRIEVEVVHVRAATADEQARKRVLDFPFDVLAVRDLPGAAGEGIRTFQDLCMTPPYPWGQWQVARLLAEHCAGLDGDLIELGVGLGGTSMFLAQQTAADRRTVYSLDTFHGLPAPDPRRDNPYFVERLYDGKVPLLDHFRDALDAHGLADRVRPMQGLFADTLPNLPPDTRFCFAHLDSDLYQSVWDSLLGVWDRLVPGGVLMVDDFFHHAQGPLRACADFFNERGIQPLYHVIFPYSVAVVKGEGGVDRTSRSLDGNAYSLRWLREDAWFRAAVEASVARAVPGTRAWANAARLLRLLEAPYPRNSDVIAYWLCLEDWWDTISFGFADGDLV